MSTRKNCARCLVPTPATATCRFGYEGTEYEIELCESHAGMLERELLGWLRLARETEPVRTVVPTQRPRDTTPPIRLLVPEAPPREVIEDTYEDEPVDVVVSAAEPSPLDEISEKVRQYRLTGHALHQLQARDISVVEIYRLLGDPSRSREPGRDGCHVYRKDGLKVVVDPRTKSIVTVARREEELIK